MAIYQKKDKDGKVIHTKDGRSWYFRDYYYNIYGEKKQYKSSYYLTKKETQLAERKWLDKISIQDNSQNISFIEVFEEWRAFRKNQLKEQSYYNFELLTDKYIKPFFKDYKLHFIKMNIINQWYEKIENYDCTLRYKNKMIDALRSFLSYCRDNYDFDGKIVSKIE